MNKSKRKMILGIILLILTMNFLVVNRSILFNDLYRNGGSLIELKVAQGVNIDEIKNNISNITNIDTENIKIENDDGNLKIRLGLLESHVIKSIENSLISEFGNDVEIRGYTRIGKANNYIGLYIVYVVVIISLILSIYIISRNIKSFSRK